MLFTFTFSQKLTAEDEIQSSSNTNKIISEMPVNVLGNAVNHLDSFGCI